MDLMNMPLSRLIALFIVAGVLLALWLAAIAWAFDLGISLRITLGLVLVFGGAGFIFAIIRP